MTTFPAVSKEPFLLLVLSEIRGTVKKGRGRADWRLRLSALSLICTVPLCVTGVVVGLGAVPGVLIAALTGRTWG